MAPESRAGANLRVKGSFSRKQLIGRKTQKEVEIVKRLTKWHENSNKRVFMIQDEQQSTTRRRHE